MASKSPVISCRNSVGAPDCALIHQPDARTAFGFVHVRGADEDGDAFDVQVAENVPELAARNRIDAVRRFIEEQNPGTMNQRARESQFLFHSAGQDAGIALLKFFEPGKTQQALDALFAFCAAHAKNIGVEFNVLAHGQVAIERKTLRHITDLGTQLLRFARRIETAHARNA